MNDRHPAGRSCLGVLTLIAGGVITATTLGGLYIASLVGGHDAPVQPATAPAAVVQQLAPTTTPTVVSTPAAATSAPRIAPRALAATTEETPVTTTPAVTLTVDLGSGVTQKVAPSNPNANKPPATDAGSLAQAGMNPSGDPVGPPAAVPPAG